MRLIKYIMKDKFLNIKSDLKDIFETLKETIKEIKDYNKTLNKLYANLMKLRYNSLKLKYSNKNILERYKIISDSDYIWSLIEFYENYGDYGSEDFLALNHALGKNNNKIYNVSYTSNIYEEIESCEVIKGHANMLMWSYINEVEDIITVTNIKLKEVN